MIAALHAETPGKGGRVLRQIPLIALCLIGLVLLVQGATIPAKARLAQFLLERAFDQSLARHQPVRPWPWADTAPVARIALPRLGVSEIVLSGGSGQALAFGPTQLPVPHGGSHGPVGIMAAHRDTHFAFLRDARKGDVIELQAIDGSLRRYRITGFQVVRWNRFAYPSAPARPLLILTTCYPFNALRRGPWRLIAWAEAV